MKVMKGCFCAVCATLITGCSTLKKYEPTLRKTVAYEVQEYLESQKAKMLLDGCSQLDKNYEEMERDLNSAILK